MKYSHAEFVLVFKALADETRLKIMEMLSCGEMCACKILEHFNVTQPTLSYHMKVLTECGLVNGRKDGAWMWYTINQDRYGTVMLYLKELAEDTPDCICKQTNQ